MGQFAMLREVLVAQERLDGGIVFDYENGGGHSGENGTRCAVYDRAVKLS